MPCPLFCDHFSPPRFSVFHYFSARFSSLKFSAKNKSPKLCKLTRVCVSLGDVECGGEDLNVLVSACV